MNLNFEKKASKPGGRYKAGKVLPAKIEGFSGGDLFRLMDVGMSPTYNVNDILLCTRKESIRNLESGEIIIAQIKKSFVVRRLVRIENHFLLVSDNKNFPLFEVGQKDISTVWKVIGKMKPAILNDGPDEGKGIPYLEKELELIKGGLRVLEEKLRNHD